MAACLVTDKVSNVTCYDPSAGSGTLLMNLAHAIGEDKCTIYSQDISQKSSSLLRLNLILNNLVHSIQNIIQGNTIQHPYHKQENGQLEKFDYIVNRIASFLDPSKGDNFQSQKALDAIKQGGSFILDSQEDIAQLRANVNLSKAKKVKDGLEYIQNLGFSLKEYDTFLNHDKVIICGDLNSNQIWDKSSEYPNHTDVVEILSKKDFGKL